MNSFKVKSEFNNGTILNRIGLKNLLLMPVLFIMVVLTIVMLLANNMQVKAYELVKPSDIDYIRWDIVKYGPVNVETFTKFYSYIKGMEKTIYSVDNKEVNKNEYIATGMHFKINGQKKTIALKGDINGDGKASATDLSVLKTVYVKQREVDYIYQKAVDMNNDNKITITDVSQLKLLLVGMMPPEEEADIYDRTPRLDGKIEPKKSTEEPTQELEITIDYPTGTNIEGYDKKVSYDGGKTYEDYKEPIKVTENAIIKAAYVNENGDILGEEEIRIENIDKEKPKEYEISGKTTTRSITIEGTTIDTLIDLNGNEVQAEVAKYMYKLDDGQWQEYNTYTGLKPSTEHRIYAKAIDKAGNEREASNNGTIVRTNSLPDVSKYITVEKSEDGPTNQDVIVTFKKDEADEAVKDLNVEYQVGGTNGEWIKGEEYTAKGNETIYIRLAEQNGLGEDGNWIRVKIDNIDKVEPDPFEMEVTPTTNSITVKATTEVTDQASEGAARETSGIKIYQYKLDDGEWEPQEGSENPSYTFENLTHGTEHTVSMRAIDKAGNPKEADNNPITISTEKLPEVSKHITVERSEDGPTKENVKLTFKKDEEVQDLFVEYQVGGTDGEWIRADEYIAEKNEIIYIRLTDEKGQGDEGNWQEIKIDNIDKISPTDFEIETTSTTNSITVKTEDEIEDSATDGARDDIAGVVGYQYKLDDGEWEPADPTQDKTYTFPQVLEQGSTHTVTMRAIDKAGNPTEKTETVKVKEIETGEVGINHDIKPEGPAKAITITFSTTTEHKIEYKIGEGETYLPYENTEIPLNTNGVIYARLKDNKDQVGEPKRIVIDTIDKIAPNAFPLSITKTTNSITVSGNTADTADEGAGPDIAGVEKYQYQIDGGDWLPEEGTLETSHTFPDLTQGSTHTISMRAIDKAGNPTVATGSNASVTVDTIPSATVGITPSLNPTTPTPRATLTLTTTTGHKIQYKKGEGEEETLWREYQESGITVDTNDAIYVRLKDETNQKGEAKRIPIDNIDNVFPTGFEYTTDTTIDSIIVTGHTTDDANEGAGANVAGIKGYQYQIDDGAWVPDTPTKEETHTFSGLDRGSTHKIMMRAIDNAGNITPATNRVTDVTLETVEGGEGSIKAELSTQQPTQSVTITLSTTTEYNIEYQKEGEETWHSYNEPIEIDENIVVKARLRSDSGDTGKAKNIPIRNIDKVNPTGFEFETVVTTNSITVRGETTDKASPGAADNIAGIKGYKYKLDEEEWTPITDKASYTFDGVSEGIDHKISMKAIDFADNEKPADNNDKTVSVKKPVTEIMEENTTKDGEKESYQNPVIPKGFKAVDEGDAIWDSEDGWDKGLIIEDENQNQFVWVPVNVEITEEVQTKLTEGRTLTVEEIRSIWDRKAWEINRTESTEATLPETYTEPYASGYSTENEEYIKMATSVLKYGGFYVARYEAGTETQRTAVANPTSTIVSRADVYPYNFVPWGRAMNNIGEVTAGSKGAVELSREAYTNKEAYGVNSSLIYGVQWDSIMRWIENERNVSNSMEWGNYRNRPYTILNGTEYYNNTSWTPASRDINKVVNNTFLLKTGAYTNTKINEIANVDGIVKNIYDLAGNLSEWTMEASGTANRVIRGGSYMNDGNNYTAASRGNIAPNQANNNIGFRAALYITDIRYNVKPSEPTKEDVIITVETTTKHKLQYKTGEEDWQDYKDKITVIKNGPVQIRLIDKDENTIGAEIIEITNIDKKLPNEFSLSTTSTSDSITVTGSTTDEASEGARDGIEGIRTYKYKLDDGEWLPEGDTLSTTFTFENVEKGVNHRVSMMAIDKVGNEQPAKNNGKSVGIDAPASDIKDRNETIDEKDKGTSQNPIIPAGFKAINTGGADWGSEDGWNKGLVIQDKDENQYVWVPVSVEISEEIQTKLDNGEELTIEELQTLLPRKAWNVGNTYNKSSRAAALAATYTEPFASGYFTEKAEYIEMATSIIKNGGFYVGRYEAGTETPRTAAANPTSPVLSKAGVYPYNFVSWGKAMNSTDEATAGSKGAVELSKELYTNFEKYGVNSSLIYGIQWDSVMEWIENEKNVSNSVNWDNYKDRPYIIPAGTQYYNGTSWITTPSNLNKTTSHSFLLKTGDYVETKTGTTKNQTGIVKNIYDIAGNVSEWTMEAVNANTRVYRGGNYASFSYRAPASYRSAYAPNNALNLIGFRSALHILDIPYKVSPTTPTKDDVTITLNKPGEYTLERKTEEGNWVTCGSTITVGKNGPVYVRAKNSEGNIVGTQTITITNIDKVFPTGFDIRTTSTTNSITVMGSTTDGASEGAMPGINGVAGYQYQLDGGEWLPANWTTNTSYTFEGVTKGVNHKVNMRAIDKVGNIQPANEVITVPVEVPVKGIMESNKTIDDKVKGTSQNPIIPQGFKPINTGGAEWGTEDGWNKGLVIQDSNDNQYVWVPVTVTISDTTIQTKLDNEQELTVAELLRVLPRQAWLTNQTTSKVTSLNTSQFIEPYLSGYPTEQEEYIETATSILKNGGFYVARYEGGTETARKAVTDQTSTLLSKADVYPYNFVSWGKAMNDTGEVNAGSKGAVELCRDTYTGKVGFGVKSNLIYGIEWDSIMKWVQGERNVSNSTTWGNHYNRAYTIPAGTEYYNGTDWVRAAADVNKVVNNAYLLKTGAYVETITGQEKNRAGITKNIYDLAGNVAEWTMENYTYNNYTYRVIRSGFYNTNGNTQPASVRYNSAVTTATNNIGVRQALAIMNIPYTLNPSTPTKNDVIITLSKTSGYTLEYQKYGTDGEWTTYTNGITAEENGMIYARLKDSTGEVVCTQRIKISNIDKRLPEPFELNTTSTRNSITVTGSTQDYVSDGGRADIAGIKYYQYQLDGGEWLPKEGTLNTSYTFEEVTKGVNHKVAMRVFDKVGNERPASNNNKLVGVEFPVKDIMDSNKTIDDKVKGTYDNPIIPQGFKPINTGGAEWGTEDGWNKGLVIQDSNENQFVWVPVQVAINDTIQTKLDNEEELTVAELARLLPRKAWAVNKASSTAASFLAQYIEPYLNGYSTEQEEYIEMATSILKNGGFYVARFEGGTATPRTAATDETSTLLSKAEVYPYNFVTWGKAVNETGEVYEGSKGAVELCRDTYTGKVGFGVKSNLIYGTQWDSIMKWIEAKKNVSNSSTWGNHSNSTYTIPTGTEYHNGTSWVSTEDNAVNKTTSNYYLLKTGIYADTKTNGQLNTAGIANNIYDLAGNVYEWTMESYNGTGRHLRGGSYNVVGTTYPASVRANSGVNQASNNIGVRQALVIMNIPYVVNPTTPTREIVTITLTKTPGYTLEYQKYTTDGDWTTYTESITTDKNGMIYARLKDSTGEVVCTQRIKIDNIDRDQPIKFDMSMTIRTDSITANGQTEDAVTEGVRSGITGIKGYQYQIDGGEWLPKEPTLETSFEFPDVQQEVEYVIWMRAVDNVGNIREANQKLTAKINKQDD